MLTWWEGKARARPRRRRARDRRPALPRDRAVPGRERAAVRPARARSSRRGNRARDGGTTSTVDLSSVGQRRGREVSRASSRRSTSRARRCCFEWRSLDHVKVSESHAQVAPRFDYFHVNSIDVDADGNLLVSARNTWAVYKIDRAAGRCSGASAGRRATSRWARARASPGSTTRGITETATRRHAVRQRGGAAGRAAVARPRCSRSTSSASARRSCASTSTRRRCSSRKLGQRADASATATSSSAGERSRTSRSTPPTAPSSSTRRFRRAARTTAPSASPGSGRRSRPRRSPRPGTGCFASWNGSTEVARVAAALRAEPAAHSPRHREGRSRASRRRSTCPRRQVRGRRRARPRRQAARRGRRRSRSSAGS